MDELFKDFLELPLEEAADKNAISVRTLKSRVLPLRRKNTVETDTYDKWLLLKESGSLDLHKYLAGYSAQFVIGLFDKKYDLRKMYTKELVSRREIVSLIGDPVVTYSSLKSYTEKKGYYLSEDNYGRAINLHGAQTKEERYGNKTYNNLDKIQKTMLDRYGRKSVGSVPEFRDKQQQTMFNRYGTKSPIMSIDLRTKMKNTMKERYGSEWFGSSERGREVLSTRDTTMTYEPTILLPTREEAINVFREPDAMELFIDTYIEPGELTVTRLSELTGIRYSSLVANSPAYKVVRHTRTFVTNYSGEQNDLENFIRDNYEGVVVTNKRPGFMKGLELDVYLPELKMAFEFNGSYWHSESRDKGSGYHLRKTQVAGDNGVYLMHIWEHDWLDPTKQAIVKSQILYKLGKSSKLYARQLTLKEVSVKEAKEFELNNHMQGYAAHSTAYGLYNNSELVALMTFGKARFNKEYEHELIRFVTKREYSVSGGASRLFKYARAVLGDSIMSYANRDFSLQEGSLYEQLGMRLIGTTKPGYVWFKPNNPVLSRYQTQPKVLSKKYDDFEGTEISYMRSKGYSRVFNTGNNVYALDKQRR